MSADTLMPFNVSNLQLGENEGSGGFQMDTRTAPVRQSLAWRPSQQRFPQGGWRLSPAESRHPAAPPCSARPPSPSDSSSSAMACSLCQCVAWLQPHCPSGDAWSGSPQRDQTGMAARALRARPAPKTRCESRIAELAWQEGRQSLAEVHP
jgi:hypothetical protein